MNGETKTSAIGKTYAHKKRGGRYTVIHEGQMQIEGVWFPAIIYQSETGEIYVRTDFSFFPAFTEIQ